MVRPLIALAGICLILGGVLHAEERPLKVFVLAGQSNMVGWGDSAELPASMQRGSNRVLMFENQQWQPLRPFKKAQQNQQKFGMTEWTFGPEIGFAHTLSEAWPSETIGIIKLAVGGTSILTWKPNWSKADANRVGQARVGPLYRKLVEKIERAKQSRKIEIMGFLWLQGGGDMKNVAVAKEYLANLKALVTELRNDLGRDDLPVICASPRRPSDPADLSDLVPSRVPGPYPSVEYVLKAQWDAQQEIPNFKTMIIRDIPTHPQNVHYNTAGQLQVGKQFAETFLALGDG